MSTYVAAASTLMVTIVFSKLAVKDTDVFYRPVMSHLTGVAYIGFRLLGKAC